MTTRIFLCSNPDNLENELKGKFTLTATVEAEYGDRLVEGSVISLAHHGSRSGMPVPCTRGNFSIELEAIGLSHLDLDAIGATLSLIGAKPVDKPEHELFWQLAGWIDTDGAHKLGELLKAFDESHRSWLDAAIHAYWAWSEQSGRVFPPRDGSCLDVTEHVEKTRDVIQRILSGDPELLAAGVAMKAATAELNKTSFVTLAQGVILRQAEQFVNHLYTTPSGTLGKAVVSYNPKTRAVTISLADPKDTKVSCVEVAQLLWGKEAGGHKGIAGGPRSGLSREEADRAFKELVRIID
jgi:hypothetical protein